MQQIEERQVLSEKGLYPVLHIFPEGATTNGKELIQFKRGAFHNLRPVKPIYFKYWSPGSSAASDILGFFKHLPSVCLAPFFTINVYELPVFTPNDYFWENHWKEGTEEKYAVFSRSVREIIAKYHGDGMTLVDQTMEDKFEFKKVLADLKKNKT